MTMKYATHIAAAAFAALALTGCGKKVDAPEVGPTATAAHTLVAAKGVNGQEIAVSKEGNSYASFVANLPTNGLVKFYEYVNCTTGLITTSSNASYANGGGTVSVTQLTPAAQELVRANCSSNGLRPGF
jgi:hypothetical protein